MVKNTFLSGWNPKCYIATVDYYKLSLTSYYFSIWLTFSSPPIQRRDQWKINHNQFSVFITFEILVIYPGQNRDNKYHYYSIN